MRMINLTCPGCAAQMVLDKVNMKAYCEYCGTVMLIDLEEDRRIPQGSIDHQEKDVTIVGRTGSVHNIRTERILEDQKIREAAMEEARTLGAHDMMNNYTEKAPVDTVRDTKSDNAEETGIKTILAIFLFILMVFVKIGLHCH